MKRLTGFSTNQNESLQDKGKSLVAVALLINILKHSNYSKVENLEFTLHSLCRIATNASNEHLPKHIKSIVFAEHSSRFQHKNTKTNNQLFTTTNKPKKRTENRTTT